MKSGRLYKELEERYLKGYLASPTIRNSEEAISYRLNVDSDNLLYLKSNTTFKHVPQSYCLIGLNIDKSG